MTPALTIAWNSFRELLRQPVYLVLLCLTLGLGLLMANLYSFSFGDDQRLVKHALLALTFLNGVFVAATSASATLSQEVRTGTALTLLAKPVGRGTFVLAKFAGLVAALAVQGYLCLLATLMGSRMAFDAYGGPDLLASSLWFGAVMGGLGAAAAVNYYTRRPFTGWAVALITLGFTVSFILAAFLDRRGHLQAFGTGVDWRLLPATLLLLLALLLVAGVALAASTRLPSLPTLCLCGSVFLLGLMSDHLFGRAAQNGSWLAQVAYTLVPNWQLFWMADTLREGTQLPWSYVLHATGYVTAYLTSCLALAVALFQERELT